MEINLPDVVAEVKAVFDQYERALTSNDVATLDKMFHDDTRTVRYCSAENLYDFAEIQAFRAARSSAGLARTLSKTRSPPMAATSRWHRRYFIVPRQRLVDRRRPECAFHKVGVSSPRT
jgi:hypothetical protein